MKPAAFCLPSLPVIFEMGNGSTRCVTLFDVIKKLMRFNDCKQRLRQTRTVKRPEILNTGCSRNVGTPTMEVL